MLRNAVACLILINLCQMATAPFVPQAKPKQNPTAPPDAKAILMSAADLNGLGAPGLQPWHILVHYEKFDNDGDNVDSGDYEEYWVSPKQYKLIFTSHDFNQTDISDEQGIHRSGAQTWPGVLPISVRDEFMRPMFRQMNLRDVVPEKTDVKLGNFLLPCVLLRLPPPPNVIHVDHDPPGFCFEKNAPILRYTRGGVAPFTSADATTYSKIVRFQGRYVARDVEIAHSAKLLLKLTLEKLEELNPIPPGLFVPAPDATLVDTTRIAVDWQLLSLDYLLHFEPPRYPASLPPSGGEASAKIVIGKDGSVLKCDVLEANPPQMRQPLDDAVSQFVFRPFLVRGEPVEVETTEKFEYTGYSR